MTPTNSPWGSIPKAALDEFNKAMNEAIDEQVELARKHTLTFINRIKPVILSINDLPHEQQAPYGMLLITHFQRLQREGEEIQKLYDQVLK
jgi:hypothetical protein